MWSVLERLQRMSTRVGIAESYTASSVALTTLSWTHRTANLCKFAKIKGISRIQLAEVMNLSAANVRQKLSRICMRLKRRMELRLQAKG